MAFRTPEIQTHVDYSFTLVILIHNAIIMRMCVLIQDPTHISTYSKWNLSKSATKMFRVKYQGWRSFLKLSVDIAFTYSEY